MIVIYNFETDYRLLPTDINLTSNTFLESKFKMHLHYESSVPMKVFVTGKIGLSRWPSF